MSVPVTDDSPGIQIVDWNTQCNFAALSNRPDILRHIKKTFGKKPIGDEVTVKKSRRTLAKLRDNLISVGETENGRHPLAHEVVRMALLYHGLLRGPSRRPQPLANLGGLLLRSA